MGLNLEREPAMILNYLKRMSRSLVAFPIACWAMQEWLQNFAYRASISALAFALGGVLVVLIALVTVSVQSLRVALANPVEALRYE